MKNKGFTLIELIVSFALITVISVSLFKTVLSVQQRQSQNIAINKFKAFQLLLNTEIENDFLKEEIESVDECGTNCYDIEYKNKGVKRLSIDIIDNVITYGSFREHLPDNYKLIDNMTIKKYESTTEGINSYIFLNIPIKSSLEPSLDSLKYMHTYDSTENSITGISDKPFFNKPVYECTYEGNLAPGAEYINGQYVYRYMQNWGGVYIEDQNPWGGGGGTWSAAWKNFDDADGWGVRVLDLNSTEPVTSRLCTSINGKPIVYMSLMFSGSKASSIDTSSYDTSNVIDMNCMFENAVNLQTLDLSTFETSNVKEMRYMFKNSGITNIDISNFDTSNVTDMEGMFNATPVQSLNLRSFDTSKVTNMANMFSGSTVRNLNLRNFVTSNVTNMQAMFSDMQNLQSLDVSTFDTSKVENMDNMFARMNLSNVLNISNFNFSKVTNMNAMFYDASVHRINFPVDGHTGSLTNMHNMFNGLSLTGMSIPILDLTGFDTGNVTDTGGMFAYGNSAIVYARTQADANKFNSSTYRPARTVINAKLPNQYQQVYYVQSSGTQYINTGAIFNSNADKFELIYEANDVTGNYFIAGSGMNETGKLWVYSYPSGNTLSLYITDTGGTQRQIAGISGPDTVKHNVTFTSKKLYIDSTLKTDASSYTFGDTPYEFSLFNATNSTGYFSKSRIFVFNMWKSGTLVRNMIPCYRKSDNVIGFYDLVNSRFYTNAGTGTFTKGDNV